MKNLDFLKQFEGFKNTEFFIFLKKVKNSRYHSSEVSTLLRTMYRAKHHPLKQKLASILNAIFTQNIQTFMFSFRTLRELFEKDKNLKNKHLSSAEYSLLLAKISNSDGFEVLRQPNRTQSGVYKLTESNLVDLLARQVGNKFMEDQQKHVLCFYDNKLFKRDKNKPKPLEGTKEERMIKASAGMKKRGEALLAKRKTEL